jgi:hypothetical protein
VSPRFASRKVKDEFDVLVINRNRSTSKATNISKRNTKRN